MTMSPDHNLDDISYGRRKLLGGLAAGGIMGVLSGCAEGGESGADQGEVVELQLHAPTFRNYPDELRYIGDEWERNLGVQVDLVTREWPTHLGEVYGGDFEGIGFTSPGAEPQRLEPQINLGDFVSDNSPNPNQSEYSNEDYDELYEQLRATFDEEERDDLIVQMQEVIREDHPFFGYGWPPFISPINTELWDIQQTAHVGAGSFNSLGIIEAEPMTDETTLIFGNVGEIDTGNPFTFMDAAVTKLLDLVYDTPMMTNFDGEIIEWACSLEIVDDTTFELTLDERIESFQDGTEVTADDLAFTFNFLNEHQPPRYAPLLSELEGAEVIGDRSVRINLSSPNYAFTTAALIVIPILPEHIWSAVSEETDEIATYNMPIDDILGFGPFEIVEWTSDQMRLRANEDYYRGSPGPDEFILVGRGSNEALRQGMVEGEIHGPHALVPPPIAEEIINANDDFELLSTPALTFEQLSIKHDTPPLDDFAFREALHHAVDIEAFNEVFYLGEFTYGDSTPVHPVLGWGTQDIPTLDEMYDPDEARRILEDAGYTWDGNDRLRYPED